jgi:hypothetical protein
MYAAYAAWRQGLPALHEAGWCPFKAKCRCMVCCGVCLCVLACLLVVGLFEPQAFHGVVARSNV